MHDDRNVMVCCKPGNDVSSVSDTGIPREKIFGVFPIGVEPT